MTTRLKICGITRLEDARYAAAAGADYLGFIQYAESPRFIEPARVREILEWVHGPEPVGVFVNATADEVNRIADEADFSLVQLHGDEPAFEVARIERPAVKALRISPNTTAETLGRRVREYEDVVEYFLLDTHSDSLRGGTGQSFDWNVAREQTGGRKVFLAGGITSRNVAECVRVLRPYAVDVSSSLETAPGKKSFEKIDAFMNALGAARTDVQAEE